jgi:His/Glu/Gln/Arg/opine family amino acid ABC transporter permease subunit
LNSLFIRVYEILVGGNRYKLLLSGLGVTLQVTVFSAFFGVVLGLLLAVMKLGDKSKGILRIPYIISSAYIDVIRGTPSVVQLLIIYHIVFGGIKNVPPVIIAIIAFAINSSAYVAEIFRGGILAVDIGQTEAGISLGLSKVQTMRYVVVPQALKNAFPALANEFIVLMKETAIVGYIALQDLTKAGDFIISRTYNAFIPLFTVALVYFVIIKFLTKLFNMFEGRLRKSDIR